MKIAILTPMEIELEPLIARLDLVAGPEADQRVGRRGDAELLALITRMGMGNAADAAASALDAGADHVLVVGVAGAVDPTLEIADVIAPAVVEYRATEWQITAPPPHPGRPTSGVLSCGDDLIVDADEIDRLRERGVIALDMETAAVAQVCDARAVPWYAVRAISDRPGDGLIDPELFAATNPDGSANPDAFAAYLAADPRRAELLSRLASDTIRATNAAADAAVALIDHVLQASGAGA